MAQPTFSCMARFSVPDRFESNDTARIATALAPWRLEHALCLPFPSPWPPFPDASGRCPGVYEDFVRGPLPRSAADRWQLGLTGLTLHSGADQDFFRVTLPDPRAYAQTRDIRPAAERATLPDASRWVPEPECDWLYRTDFGGRIAIATVGRLEIVAVLRAGTGPMDELRIYRGGIFDRGLSRGPALRKTLFCPKTYLGLSSVVFSFGEMGESMGDYALKLLYTIEAYRGVPEWVRTVTTAAGMKAIVDLPCADGGSFPACTGGAGGRGRLEVAHPIAPRFPDCIADGPGCWETVLLNWPAVSIAFDVIFTADPRVQFELYDSNQKLVARSQAMPNIPAPTGQMSFRLYAPRLSAGLHVMTIKGPPALTRWTFCRQYSSRATIFLNGLRNL